MLIYISFMLEEKIQENNGMDLMRIAYTTIGYGYLGLISPNPNIITPVSASVGCILSIIDETNKSKIKFAKDNFKKFDLFKPAFGMIVGGYIGSQIMGYDAAESMKDLYTYIGASIGGILGFYDSIVKKYTFKDYN